MCDPLTIAAAASTGMTMISGVASGKAARESALLQAEGFLLQSEQMQERIEQIELQSTLDELQRRDEYLYLTSKNVASASATGISVDSESFRAIQERNAKQYRIDNMIAEMNKVNAQGQAAAQGVEAGQGSFAAIKAGKKKQQGILLDTAATVLMDGPGFFAKVGSDSADVSTNNVNGGPMTESIRPKGRLR